jgi:nitrite reductase/ring-hydroxylating ferredoxin subunit
MSEFVPVASANEIAAGTCAEVWVNDTPVALCNVDGRFHAVAGRCPHRGGPLGQGSLDGPILLCPWHAWDFDVKTGATQMSSEIQLERYQVRIEDGRVLVKVR